MTQTLSDPNTGLFDPAGDFDGEPPVHEAALPASREPASTRSARRKREPLRFYRRSELMDIELPEGVNLVGDAHVFRGSIFVLGGAPGVGKSRAAVALAVAGATGAPWFGLPVHRRFRTMILQSENGLLRLKNEFADLPADIEDHVLISRDMAGFPFDDAVFRADLANAIKERQPDVLMIDPWGDAVADNMEKDYKAAFANIMECLPNEDWGPALFIVAHTRKPKVGDQHSGRGLLNLLSGSQVLGSKPRAAFILQAATEDTDDDRVVFTCCKNNNGPLGGRSAWRRRNGLFEEVADFDWSAYEGGKSGGHGNELITVEAMANVFDQGREFLPKAAAVAALIEQTGCSKSAAYNAVDKAKSRFRERLEVEPIAGKIGWRMV